MNIQKINAITFSAKTDDGNEYKKCSAGKLTGLASGIGWASYSIYNAGKKMKTPQFKEEFEKSLKKSNLNAKQIELAKKQFKTMKNIGFGIAILIYSGIGLGLGAIADAIINSHRRNKADDLAESISKNK